MRSLLWDPYLCNTSEWLHGDIIILAYGSLWMCGTQLWMRQVLHCNNMSINMLYLWSLADFFFFFSILRNFNMGKFSQFFSFIREMWSLCQHWCRAYMNWMDGAMAICSVMHLYLWGWTTYSPDLQSRWDSSVHHSYGFIDFWGSLKTWRASFYVFCYTVAILFFV